MKQILLTLIVAASMAGCASNPPIDSFATDPVEAIEPLPESAFASDGFDENREAEMSEERYAQPVARMQPKAGRKVPKAKRSSQLTQKKKVKSARHSKNSSAASAKKKIPKTATKKGKKNQV